MRDLTAWKRICAMCNNTRKNRSSKMATSDESAPPSSERELAITRTVDAPRELVWKAFTEAERLVHWWGPQGSATVVHALDFRPGGVFHYSIRSPDGQVIWGTFVYHDIQAPERMVFVNSF